MGLKLGWPGPDKPDEKRSPTDQADHSALTDAFERYATSIYRFAYRRLGNPEDAQDVTSQVFFKAAKGLKREFDEEARRAWLFKAARSAIADIWRSYGDYPAVPLEWYAEESGGQARADSDAAIQVSRILSALPTPQRKVLEMRFLEGKSLRETALELGTTEGNVKVIQHRALRRAAELEKEGTDV
jgi:RNA polymerase sigma-70 factor (ECF subfamily)